MPNSDHTITKDRLVRRALRRLGSRNPDTGEIAEASEVLEDVVKELDVQGKWLWTIAVTETTLNTVAGTRIYTVGTVPVGLPTDMLDIDKMWLLDGTSYSPIDKIEHDEATSTYEREGTGRPHKFYFERATNSANHKLHLFQTPDAAYVVKYTYRRRLYDFDNSSANPDFPTDSINSLVKILSSELSNDYAIPLAERQWLKAEAVEARLLMKGTVSDTVPNSTVSTIYF
jgi:hypothetical protein